MKTKNFLFLTIFISFLNINSERPCPTLSLVTYNPKKNPKMPEGKGFVAGTYFDGSTVYVGTGNSELCKFQPNMPARISTTKRKGKRPGAYVECKGQQFDGKTPAFLLDHQKLRWVEANITMLSSLTGAVVIKSGDFGFFIGRINLTSSKGFVYQQVSKLHVNNGVKGFWYTKEDGTTSNTDFGYEVLVCTRN